MSPRDVRPTPPVIPGLTFVRELGQGGYSIVYEYKEEHPQRRVAVKVPKDSRVDEAVRQQFAHEANVMAKLGNHAHIGQVLASGLSEDGRPYLKMAYYPGHDLAQRAEQGLLTVTNVVEIGIAIADAVNAAHSADVVHRDIKPANILIDDYEQPRLTDFGIAGRLVTADENEEFGLSIPWSPPEILRGESGSVASDVYSLGATIWHLLVGHSPFVVVGGDNSRAAIEQRILHTPAPRPPVSDIPPALADLLTEALAKNAHDRPRTARAFATALRQIERDLDVIPTETVRRTSDLVDRDRPRRLRKDLTETVVRPRDAFAALLVSTNTSPRSRTPVAATPSTELPRPAPPEADRTISRPVVQAADTPDEGETVGGRRTVWIWAAAAGLVAVGVVAVIAANADGSGAPTARHSAGTEVADGDQNAGALGENLPPGVPTVKAARTSPTTVQFTWTYSAPLASDTFRWRTSDGKKSGTSSKPSLDVTDPAGTRVCLQVTVVRADGTFGTTEWSPEGCGS